MEFTFPNFVRASDDIVTPQPPQPSLLDLVIQAQGELSLVPQREAAKRRWADEDEDADDSDEKHYGSERVKSGGDKDTNDEEAVISTLTGWHPTTASMSLWMRHTGLITGYAQMHNLRTSLPANRVPPPLLRLEDARLPAVVEASLRHQIEVANGMHRSKGRHARGQQQGPSAPNDIDPMRFAKLEQLKDLVLGDDNAISGGAAAAESGINDEHISLLKGIAAFALPCMLLGQHTVMSGPKGGGKRTAALLALGCNTIVSHLRQQADKAEQESAVKKEEHTQNADEGDGVSPASLVLCHSFSDVAESARWLAQVFGPTAFSFWTLDRQSAGLTPLLLRGIGGADNDSSAAAMPPPAAVADPALLDDLLRIVQHQETPVAVADTTASTPSANATEKHSKKNERESDKLAERHRRGDSAQRDGRDHSRSRHRRRSSRDRRHRRRSDSQRRRHRSRSRRHHRRHRSDSTSSRHGRHHHKRSRHDEEKERRDRRHKSRDTKEAKKVEAQREEGQAQSAQAAGPVVASSTTPPITVCSAPPVSVVSTHDVNTVMDSWMPSFLQQRIPLLLTTYATLQGIMEQAQGAASALPVEHVRTCLLHHSERLVLPPLKESLQKMYWISLTNAMDVDCQFLLTADRCGREVQEFVRHTLLPDVSAEGLAVWEQDDESIWSLVRLDVQGVSVVMPESEPRDNNKNDDDAARRAHGRTVAEAIEKSKAQHLAGLVTEHFDSIASRNETDVSAAPSSMTKRHPHNSPRVLVITTNRREQEAVMAHLSRLLMEEAKRFLRVTPTIEADADVIVVTDHQLHDPRDSRALSACSRDLDLLIHFSLPREVMQGSREEMAACLGQRCRAALGSQSRRLFHTRWLRSATQRVHSGASNTASGSVDSIVLLTDHNMQGKSGNRMMEVIEDCRREL